MNNQKTKNKTALTIKKYSIVMLTGWTLIILIITVWNSWNDIESAEKMAIHEARIHFTKDVAFRAWVADHGGVYVKPTSETPPNPYLSHIPNRDIETENGKELTLMNPAYVIRQVMDNYEKIYGIRGHITSLKPIRPKNVPEEWEKKALKQFEQGLKEYSEISMVDNVEHLRMMQPFGTEKSCLKCHEHQGYKEGDIRGGISVSVPMGPYFEDAYSHIIISGIEMFFFWLAGVLTVFFGASRLQKQEMERDKVQEDLAQSEERLNLAMSVANDGVWDWNLQTNHVEFDKRYYEMAGYEYNEFAANVDELKKRIHPDDILQAEKAVEEYLNGDRHVYETEFRFLKKDGEYMWILAKGKIVDHDKNGNPIRFVGTHSDITKRKLADEELAKTTEETNTMNRLMQGREMRVIELKKEINSLMKRMGKREKYKNAG